MFTCSRLVDKATANDDLQPAGMVLAEALSLAQKDALNARRLVQKACEKLDSAYVIVRIKAVRFLQHLNTSNVPSVAPEVRLFTDKLSKCISWRGEPHPTRGFEPYSELKEAAQELLDAVMSTQVAQPEKFSVRDAMHEVQPVMEMESYGNSEVEVVQLESLEPKRLPEADPAASSQTFVPDRKAAKLQREREREREKAYAKQRESIAQSSLIEADDSPVPACEEEEAAEAPPPEPKPHGQFTRLEADITFQKSDKGGAQNMAVMRKSQTVRATTPAGKLLLVSGNRSFPTNAELMRFRATCFPDSYAELVDALGSTDWRVKLRAISGLGIFGEKFGVSTVAGLKERVLQISKSSAQSSLKSVAARFYSTVKDVEPTAPPDSSFNFDELPDEEVEDDTQGFSFE